MKKSLKLGLSLLFVTVLAVGISLVTEAPAGATPTCPPVECPSNLSGYTYVSTCATLSGPGPCLGWIWEKNLQQCHVSALG